MKATAILLLALACFAATVLASSHSESPNTADSPVSDWSDLYAFRSYEDEREDYITILANLYPLQAPYGGPNYYTISDQFFYEIYFDNDADCVEDLTFQFFFGAEMGGEEGEFNVEPNDRDCNTTSATTQTIKGGIALDIGEESVAVPLKFVGPITEGEDGTGSLNWFEHYYINLVTGDRDSGETTALTHEGEEKFVKPFDYAGEKTFPDYDSYADQYIYNLDMDGVGPCDADGQVFVGQRADPFYITLGKIFDLLNLVPIPGFEGAIEDDLENNDLKNRNVHVIALELPISCFAIDGDVLGIWLGTRRLFHDGDEHIAGGQVSRLGNPLVNELVIGLPDKSKFSHSHPVDDATNFLTYVTNPTLPAIISSVYLSAVNEALGQNFETLAPPSPRNDLVAAFLTGITGLTQSTVAEPTACEYLRLNPSIAPVVRADQKRFGVIEGDNAGFPNGRRPGDDLVDIALRVVMGKLCYIDGLGFCTPDDAPVGNVAFIDGSPVKASYFKDEFPYLNTPYPGATTGCVCGCTDGGDSAASNVEPFYSNLL